MSDSEEFEAEIEFLDEDAGIVQQCLQNVENMVPSPGPNIEEKGTSPTHSILHQLLVELPEGKQDRSKRKRREDDDDVDYDPKEDIYNPENRSKKRKTGGSILQRSRRVEFHPKPQLKKDPFDPRMDLITRRKLKLRIPDYNDPLCLPVRALRKDPIELKKLRNWNNLCLEHFKNYDTLLRVDNKPTVASKRIVVLKNTQNRTTGKVETMMSAKLVVENIEGEKKTEVTQAVLPRYREKKLLNFKLTNPKRNTCFYIRDEVILTKEVQKGEESLIAYKPKESLSLVYKMFDNASEKEKLNIEEEDKKHLREVASVKICAPCYQTSWRSSKTKENSKIKCLICNRNCITVYNMLAHMKSHPNAVVRSAKREIARSLASVVEYHYKCKICEDRFLSIKSLRAHVKSHKGMESFRCEICCQTVYSNK